MSAGAQRAFVRRGFGPAIDRRLISVEGLSGTELEAGLLVDVLVANLDHAGLDASMLELFHVAGGVPWRRCQAVARATHIPITDDPPTGGGPAEHAREAVVLTVDGPPDRQAWATRALLAALQGLHRHLEAEPQFRMPAARPLLAGVSDDERHLVLRADGPTTRALLALSPAELRTVTGLPVRSISGGRTDPGQHRPVVLSLTLCALLLLGSVVGKQWQVSSLTGSLRSTQDTLVALQAALPAAPVVAVAASVSPPETEPAGLSAEEAGEPDEPPAEAAPPDEALPQGLTDPRELDAAWVAELEQVMAGSGASIEAGTHTLTVAFSDDLLAFDPGEAALSDAASKPIRDFARFLSQHPELRVWVEGHTDDASYSNGNWLLGAQRALAVVERLTRAGVPPQHVVLTSHGEHRPVAPNSTAAGRRKNRRVELLVARPAGGGE